MSNRYDKDLEMRQWASAFGMVTSAHATTLWGNGLDARPQRLADNPLHWDEAGCSRNTLTKTQ